MAESMNGYIKVNSTINGGSVFTFAVNANVTENLSGEVSCLDLSLAS